MTTVSATPTPISSVLPTTTTTTPPTAGSGSLGKDDFLKLLVAQLKYQDPLNPADGTEFVAQTSQLTSVETLKEVSALLKDSLAVQQQWSSAGMVGRSVTYKVADGTTASGTVTSVLLQGDPVLRVRTPAGTTQDVPMTAVTAVSAAD
jgi:flagellar basal-body rod modification protein FlgD